MGHREGDLVQQRGKLAFKGRRSKYKEVRARETPKSKEIGEGRKKGELARAQE